MRKILLSILFLISAQIASNAQDEEETLSKVDAIHDVHIPLLATLCENVNGDISENPTKVLIPKGARFYVLEYKNDGSALVQFWYGIITNDEEHFDKSVVFKSKNDLDEKKDRNTYLIAKKDLDNRTRRRYSTAFLKIIKIKKNGKQKCYYSKTSFSGVSITGGVTVMPFKFRPSVKLNGKKEGFDFSKDIQLGLSGGIRYRMSHYNPYYLNVLYNIGISSITMDEYNTQNTITGTKDIAALTHAVGVVLDFKKLQFGVFAGWDKISDKNQINWIYQGKGWWSIGFGYSIFSVSTKPISGGTSTNN